MNTSGAPIKKFRSSRRTETDTTGDCLKLVLGLGLRAWRVNSGSAKGGKFRGAPAGTGDIVGRFHRGLRDCRKGHGLYGRELAGVMFSVETKNDHSDNCNCDHCKAQRVWGAELEADGGLYYPRIRSSAQLLTALDKTTSGLILPF